MFTTKYWKNTPKPAKRRVKKYEDGGAVEADPAEESASEEKKNPFDDPKWKAVKNAYNDRDEPKRQRSAVPRPIPFKTGF